LDARQRKHQHRATQSGRSHDVTGANSSHKRRPSSSATPFKGTCFSCGRSGHRQVDCRASVRDNRKEPSKESERKRGVDYPTCDHCKRPGHTEGACWQKHGKPKNIMLFRRGRNLASTPVATLLYDDKAANFPYLIDSGADVSILCESAAIKLGAPITPEVRLLSGIGTRHVYSSGTSYLVAVLPTVTLEVLFTIVADDTIPGNLSAIIGWDVIGRTNLRIDKTADGLELHHDLLDVPRVMTMSTTTNFSQLKVSGLDEQSLSKLKQLLLQCHEKTPDHIVTGKLSIKLKDDIPIAYGPRRLAYAERIQLKKIIQDLLQGGIIRESHSSYASPIVLVKSHGCTQILVIVDAFSKYCSLKPIKSKTSEDSIKALFSVFKQLGQPRRIIADRGTAFTSTMFRNFLSEQQVELHHIATRMPRGNGQVERVMRTVFNLLRATLTDQKESTWVEALADIETVINSTVHATTGFAPTVLQLGSNPRLPATVQMLPEVVATNNYIDPEEAVVHTHVRMTNIEDKQAERFNVTRYAAKLFSLGDLVAVENSQLAGGGKLKSKYSGPFTVRAILPNERYLLWRKGKRTTVAAHEQLRSSPETQPI
jgi:hypothetical protein